MPVTLEYVPRISEGGTFIGAMSLDEWLDSGELVASVGVVEVAPGAVALTIDNVAVSATELVINGERVAAGRAVVFRVSGQLAAQVQADGAGLYRVRATVRTDSTPFREHVLDLKMQAL